MADLPSILRGMRHHMETVLAALDGRVRGDARERLLAHVRQEEENHLAALAEHASPEAETARQHSRFIIDIIQGREIDPEVGRNLLAHMLEEHSEARPERAWTVGSLMERKVP